MGKTFVWTYDNAGNITSRKEYSYISHTAEVSGEPTATYNYTYGDDSWGDLLTAYDGVARTYDEIGNVLTDGTWTYTWQNGRELAAMTDGTTTWNYTYDANGMRTSRTNGTTTYNYVYNGSQLTQMTVGNDTLYFTYGVLGPITVTWNGETYYYALNGQGDVTGIFDGNGTLVVTYAWDNAWGYNPIPEGVMASTLGELNPLRYRSYVYDTETGYYYLQSRYYDPEIGRFINADIYLSTGDGLLGNNMFAYCVNSPTNFRDDGGNFLCSIIGAVVGAAFGAIDALIQGKTGNEFAASVLSGATSGAITGVATDVLLVTGGSALVVAGTMAAAGVVGAVASSAVTSGVTGKSIDWEETAADAIFDGATGALFGYMGGPVKSGIKSGVKNTVKAILRREVRELGSTIAEEALSGVTAGIMGFTVDVVIRQIKSTVAITIK